MRTPWYAYVVAVLAGFAVTAVAQAVFGDPGLPVGWLLTLAVGVAIGFTWRVPR